MSARKSSHRTIFLIVSSGSPLALIASSLRSTSKKPVCPMTRSLHPPMAHCRQRVRFAATWREEFFEVPKCNPSEQFAEFTWCQKTRQEREPRGSANVTYSILHSHDGLVVYVNRYQEPAFFGPNEAVEAIRRNSTKMGETAQIKRLPPRRGFPEGVIAT